MQYTGDVGLDDTMYPTCSVKKGQEGFILRSGRLDKLRRKWLKFVIAREDAAPENSGWTLESTLTVGQVVTKATMAWTSYDGLEVAQSGNAGSVLQKTVSALLVTLKADKLQLMEQLGARLIIEGVDITDTQISSEITKHLWKGMSGVVRKIMDNGSYNFDQLWELPRTREYEITKLSDTRAVIYGILLKSNSGKEGSNLLYVGKTGDAGHRFKIHRWKLLPNSKQVGQSYVLSRHAKAWRMTIFVDLSKVLLAKLDATLSTIEWIFVMLNRSWPRTLFAIEDAGQLEKWWLDIVSAKKFQNMAGKLFAFTGWQPCSKVLGANWQTPLIDTLGYAKLFQSRARLAMPRFVSIAAAL